LIGVVATVFASTTDQSADRVLGQIDLSHNTPDFGGPAALNGPIASIVDAQGHLYVVDQGNNRVLGYASAAAFKNGAPADLVIGESDSYSQFQLGVPPGASNLNNPMGVVADPQGNLYVSDFGNNRVLEFDAPFLSGYTAGQPANLVLGQTNLTASKFDTHGTSVLASTCRASLT